MEEKKSNDGKNYFDERFEFAIYVNNFIICKRFVRIYNFVEHSMETLEFKNCVDEIVSMIQDDLKTKSRVWTWYNFNPENPDMNKPAMVELTSPTIKPWECTFKFEITDNGHPVITKIWDGSCYPRAVRDNVDLANKSVKVPDGKGGMISVDKESFFGKNKDNIFGDLLVTRAMIMGRPDVLSAITKKIVDTCSSVDNLNKRGNTNTSEVYGNGQQGVKSKKYNFSIEAYNNKVLSGWGSALSEKTKKYFKNIY